MSTGEDVGGGKEILKCKACGAAENAGAKFNKKTQECKKCYQVRWLREKREKKASIGKEGKSNPAPKPQKQRIKEMPANGSSAIARLDEEIGCIKDFIVKLESEIEAYKYRLSVYEEVRGMLG